MGGIPPIAAGELNFQLPYSGIKELIDAARSIILPRQRAMEETYEWIFREMSTQYASGGFGKLRIHGKDGGDEYFDMELSSKDIKGDWFPEVKLLPRLPEDDMNKIAMARLAVESGLLSPQTARDTYLGVQDTDAEEERVLLHKARQLPAVQVREMVMALMKDGKFSLANAVMKDYMQTMEQQTTRTQGRNLYISLKCLERLFHF